MARKEAARARAAAAGPFFCAACGNESPKWFGKCPHCGAWNSAAEAPAAGPRRASGAAARSAGGYSGAATCQPGRRAGGCSGVATSPPVRLEAIETGAEDRWRTGIAELDRVLGGGLVPGSLV